MSPILVKGRGQKYRYTILRDFKKTYDKIFYLQSVNRWVFFILRVYYIEFEPLLNGMTFL